MRGLKLTLLLVCALVAVAAAWTAEDYEIFRVRDEVAASEGADTTFYSFIGVSPSSTRPEIQRAYRRKSKQIHPDKARQSYLATYAKPTPQPKAGTNKPKAKPGVTVRKRPSQREIDKFTQEADKRFQLLSVAADILQEPERRERYDYFLRNGFPKWRGTGYYYQRFRPGLGSVLVGLLVVFGGAAHYGAMYLSWKRQRDFVERYIRHARQMAWGNEMGVQGIPGIDVGATATPPNEMTADTNGDGAAMNWNRKQKRQQERENRRASKNPKAAKVAKSSGISTPVEAELTSGPTGAKKRVVAENGKVLIVDSVGNVYLEEETEDGDIHEYLLDVDEIPKPTVSQTVLFRLPIWIYNQSIGRVLGRKRDESVVLDMLGDQVEPDGGEESLLNSATAPNQNAEARKRKPKIREK